MSGFFPLFSTFLEIRCTRSPRSLLSSSRKMRWRSEGKKLSRVNPEKVERGTFRQKIPAFQAFNYVFLGLKIKKLQKNLILEFLEKSEGERGYRIYVVKPPSCI